MKLLASVLLYIVVFTILGAGVSAFGEPIVTGSGTVKTAILQTPEFEVDTSGFSTTGEIILDVKFENPPNEFHGINWVFENPSADGLNPDPVEFYEKYQSQRMFFISIKDATNEEKQKLEKNQFVVTTNDEFIESRYNENHDKFEVEVLNIDKLVLEYPFSEIKTVKTQLRLSSPELVAGNVYEILLWTETRSVDPIVITLPPIQEIPTPAPMEIPNDAEEAEILEETDNEIPKWIKDIFSFYSEGLINDDELIGALQFLIRSGIIQI